MQGQLCTELGLCVSGTECASGWCVRAVVMVDVPAGPFSMGCNAAIDSQCFSDEGSLRTVDVPRFAIDATEVTAGAYDDCVAAGACTAPSDCGRRGPHHPVVCVDRFQADAYRQWRGKRLPTEAEWEKAARGTDGRIWATGNTAPTCAQANMDGCVSGNLPRTWPAGSQAGAVSPYGAFDMAGNVWEWTADWHDEAQQFRSVRGGSWVYEPRVARASTRDAYAPSARYNDLGLRCARSP